MKRLVFGLILATSIAACTGQNSQDSDPFNTGQGDPNNPPQPPPPACLAKTAKEKNVTLGPAHETFQKGAWTRHVIREKHDDKILVLILEEHSNPKIAPRLILRQGFSTNAQAEAAIEKAQSATLIPNLTTLTLTNNPIWPIENSWTEDVEKDYSKWIHDHAAADFFIGSGLTIDCADFAMGMRWVYAREHHLPAGDTISGSGKVWGSWMSTTAWDQLPTATDWKQDTRFKAALSYVLGLAYTQTIIKDLYPVQIDPAYITSGTIYLTLYGTTSGHTRTITNIGKSDKCSGSAPCISIVYGSLPAAEYGYEGELIPYWVPQGEGGFLRFRWPEQDNSGSWSLKTPAQMPGYSDEQFKLSDVDYSIKIDQALDLFDSPEQKFTSIGSILQNAIISRMGITEMGYYLCSLVPCQQGDTQYNAWSTPERDATFASQLAVLQATNYNHNDPGVQYFVQGLAVELFPGGPKFSDILLGAASAHFSSDPTGDFFSRWGLATPADDAAHLAVLAKVAYDNYVTRINQVYQQQDTTRLDQAFRVAQQQFQTQYQAASPAAQAQTDTVLKSQTTGIYYCGSAGSCGSNECTMYNLMVQDPSHIQNMKSGATDSTTSRFGF